MDRGPARIRFLTPLVAVVLLAVALFPAALATPAMAGRSAQAVPELLFGGFSANATWDGKNISGAGTPSDAFSIGQGGTAAVGFTYRGVGTASVGNASLTVTYLGIALTTSKVQAHVIGGPPVTGAAQLNWSFGALEDALEGVFQLTASLLFTNGSTAWSETFLVLAKTPYDLESGAVVVLLILAIAELYWGVAAIREARRSRRTGRSGPSSGTPPAPPVPWTPPTPSGGPGAPPAAEGEADPANPAGGGSSP